MRKAEDQTAIVDDEALNSEFSIQNSAFDDLAGDYDDTFTRSAIGRLMRAAVWRRLESNFRPGGHVVELKCGTGPHGIHPVSYKHLTRAPTDLG